MGFKGMLVQLDQKKRGVGGGGVTRWTDAGVLVHARVSGRAEDGAESKLLQ
jgi:hypothetical protein